MVGHPARAQPRWYAGGGPGVSTHSADARSIITPASTAISQYKPENGPLAHLFAGWHLLEYVSVQAAYSWSRNDLAMLSTRFENSGSENTYEQARHNRRHDFGADVLVYFRSRQSRIRPFLLTGLGVKAFASDAATLRVSKGSPVLPPPRFTATQLGLRSAAGIDVLFGKSGWGVRYAFLETIQGNPISPRLDPPGLRKLAHFQNTFAVVKYFD